VETSSPCSPSLQAALRPRAATRPPPQWPSTKNAAAVRPHPLPHHSPNDGHDVWPGGVAPIDAGKGGGGRRRCRPGRRDGGARHGLLGFLVRCETVGGPRQCVSRAGAARVRSAPLQAARRKGCRLNDVPMPAAAVRRWSERGEGGHRVPRRRARAAAAAVERSVGVCGAGELCPLSPIINFFSSLTTIVVVREHAHLCLRDTHTRPSHLSSPLYLLFLPSPPSSSCHTHTHRSHQATLYSRFSVPVYSSSAQSSHTNRTSGAWRDTSPATVS
jgi:hypothetical protein